MIDSNTSIIDDKNSLGGELAEVDGLLENAATCIDTGKYEEAISCFTQVLEKTRVIFGDKIELTEIHGKINDVQNLLLELKG